MKTAPRPFAMNFLETVADEKLDDVAGGAKSAAGGGGVFTTQAISAPIRIGRHKFGKPDRF